MVRGLTFLFESEAGFHVFEEVSFKEPWLLRGQSVVIILLVLLLA